MMPATVWMPLEPMTPDGLPIIGESGVSRLFLNTGHGTLGWTIACGSGRVLVGGWAIQQLWLFWVAPIVGAALAGFANNALFEKRPDVVAGTPPEPAGLRENGALVAPFSFRLQST